MLRMNAARRRLRSPFVIGYAPGEYGCRPASPAAPARNHRSIPRHPTNASARDRPMGPEPAQRHVHDCSRPDRAASLRLMPLACISPAPRLFRPSPSSATNHRAALPKARYWQTCPIVQPRPRATHIMRHHRAACSVSLPDPSITPECRLSRGFCTALRVFKRV